MSDLNHFHQALALWVIRLNDDNLQQRQQALDEFQLWKAQYPEHQDQIDQMFSFADEMQQFSTLGISSQTVTQSLAIAQHSQNRMNRLFGKVMGFAVLFSGLVGLSFIGLEHGPFAYYRADIKTDTGEMHHLTLEDGSQLSLAAHSAVNIHFDAQQRRIDLIEGAIYLDVAKDPQRPLRVHTAQADYQALGTRFIVLQESDKSTLSMLHSQVSVTATSSPSTASSLAPASLESSAAPALASLESSALAALESASAAPEAQGTDKQTIVSQAQQISVTTQGLGQIQAINIAATEMAWQQQQIVADQMPLADVLNQLKRHHQGVLWFNAEALQAFKITGVIHADQDLDQTLSLLMQQNPQLQLHKVGSSLRYIRVAQQDAM
ncbi:FecR family protein [Acinetobacter calcoaceticus]|uniref:FecR family protein n=1 Tax=Acinetobacter calcoaceticus TaxID=471 RepID=A0A4R1Y2H2_ACICA|nr:FecR family protein [Acinetobacter calcoaceticus]